MRSMAAGNTDFNGQYCKFLAICVLLLQLHTEQAVS